MENIVGLDNLNHNRAISQQVFTETWKRDAGFRQTIREALPKLQYYGSSDEDDNHTINASHHQHGNHNPASIYGSKGDDSAEETGIDDSSVYFEHLDQDQSGDIDIDELKALVKHRFYNGWETYLLDTLGLSSLSIAAVSMSIKLGLHPVVAATSGVTVCFGGILRDLLCDRDLAIGSQSYAFATGASSATYVFFRELAIRRIAILPLAIRTFLAAGVCVGLRAWEYARGKPLLRSMHGD